MDKAGYDALEKMFRAYLDKGVTHFTPDEIGLGQNDLSELLLAGVVDTSNNINDEIIFDPEEARRFLDT